MQTSKLEQQVMDKLGRREFDAVVSMLSQMSASGDGEATRILGCLYMSGVGVVRNAGQARELFTLASTRGDTQAFIELSRIYAEGLGVASDTTTAIRYCEEAAARGDVRGFVIIGGIHEQGDYQMPQNYTLAQEYYRRAADAGSALANYRLSRLYLEGKGVARDQDLAFKLCAKAADGSDPEGLRLPGAPTRSEPRLHTLSGRGSART